MSRRRAFAKNFSSSLGTITPAKRKSFRAILLFGGTGTESDFAVTETQWQIEEVFMQNNIARCATFAFALIALAAAALAQPQNTQALSWFKTGNEERDLQKKIAAYEKAIALDSSFAEAYFNLGMAYKQRQDYANTEKFLRSAYALKSARFTSEQKSRLIYELSLAVKRSGKTAQAEKLLREAVKTITDKKLRSMAVFELGKLLSEQNRFAEALQELRDGEKIDPANQTYFRNLIQIAEDNLAMQSQYEQAEAAEARGQWHEARKHFEEIQKRSTNYRDVALRMNRIDSTLRAEAAKSQTLAATYEQAQQYEKAGNLELAISVYEHLLQQANQPADLPATLEQARAKLEARRISERAESEYTVGLAALKAQNWTGAILAFERVLAIDKNHAQARAKIDEAQANLQRESTENMSARYYADGLAAMERGDWGGALAAFEKVRRLDSSYREVKKMLAQVERALEVPRQIAAQEGGASVTRVQTLYEDALVAMAKEDWMQAVIGLETIQLLQPNYRDVAARLNTARANLGAASAAGAASETDESFSLNVAILLTTVVMVPLLGFLFFSPAMRARYHLLRGNHAAVAQIYERMLARDPQRAKLNPAIMTTLSNYYLMSGRVDDQALDVYKKAREANFIAANTAEINSLLKQHNLPESGHNTEALKVLENSLNNRKTSPHTSK